MRKAQCALALMALCVGMAQSWDIAISAGNVIEFYTNGAKTNSVQFKSQNLTALAYDEVHNMMLFVDKQNDSDSICGYNYNLSSDDITCFIKRSGGNIHDLAFDPVTELLFFTDTNEKSINWISLKTSARKQLMAQTSGNLLMKMNDRTPTDVAVDSCNGYLYWSNTDIPNQERIERALFNGSKREAVYKMHYDVFSIAIDQQTQKMYFFHGYDGIYSFFNSEDFKRNLSTVDYMPENKEIVLTVSKDYWYWITSSESYKSVWQMPKKFSRKNIKEFGRFYNNGSIGIAANYRMEEQSLDFQGCEALAGFIRNKFDRQYCVHGEVSGQSDCNCTPGYIGERCDVSVCLNYCIQGNCSYNDEGLPKCSCNAGYSGGRCEVNVCLNYCLNDGDCSLNEEDAPVCRCVGDHEGARCEAVTHHTVTNTTSSSSMYYSAGRNLTLADLLLNWRKPTAKVTVTVEV